MKKMKTKSGFTVGEILIVIIILGIIAAVMIPQFTEAPMTAEEIRQEAHPEVYGVDLP